MAVRLRRFDRYVLVPEVSQFREVDALKTRLAALAGVLAEARAEVDKLEDELMRSAAQALSRGHTNESVARWCRRPTSTLITQVGRWKARRRALAAQRRAARTAA